MDETLRRIRAENGIIRIGKMGEIPPAIVEIPLGNIRWGTGRAEIKHRRAGDTGAYLVGRVETEGDHALWYLSEADLAKKGAGEAEVVWYAEDGHRLKTDIYRVIVDRALEDAAGELDAWEGICDRVAENAERAQQAAQRAEAALDSAEGKLDYEKLRNLPKLDGREILGNIPECDPTVPQWAKAPSRPEYSAEDVGAMPENAITMLDGGDFEIMWETTEI